MGTTARTRATLADLMATPGKAELIDGSIVPLMATGYLPSRIAARIFEVSTITPPRSASEPRSPTTWGLPSPNYRRAVSLSPPTHLIMSG